MSEIRNGRLELYYAKYVKCNHMITLGFKGLITSHIIGCRKHQTGDSTKILPTSERKIILCENSRTDSINIVSQFSPFQPFVDFYDFSSLLHDIHDSLNIHYVAMVATRLSAARLLVISNSSHITHRYQLFYSDTEMPKRFMTTPGVRQGCVRNVIIVTRHIKMCHRDAILCSAQKA